MYNNNTNPNFVMPGEQGCEKYNQSLDKYQVQRGTFGFQVVYAKITMDSLSWNERMQETYRMDTKLREETGWSHQLWNDMESIIERTEQMQEITDIINKNGLYICQDIKPTITKESLERMLEEAMEFSVGTGNYTEYTSKCIHAFCAQHSNGSCFLSKSKHLKLLQESLYNQFTTEFLIRRCNDWGYYFKQ